MKKIYILLFTLLLFGKLHAQTWDGSVSNDWNNMDNWTPAGVPTATSTVSIPGGLMGVPYPKMASDVTIRSINMTAGSSLDFNGFVLNINNLNTYPQIHGATLNNTDVTKDIVINIDLGGAGYTASFGANTINDVFTMSVSGASNTTFYECNLTPGNQYNHNATFNINGACTTFFSYLFPSKYEGNLIINRTVAGTSNTFSTGNTIIDGNFSLTNLMAGGINNIGNNSTATTIAGKVDIDINYPTRNTFNLRKIENTTGGGIINIQNSLGYNVDNNKLVVNSLSITGMGGAQYGYFNSNIVTGNVTLSDDVSYGSGYEVFITRNKITGQSIITNNGFNTLSETHGANSANEFIGDVIITASATGRLDISEADNSIFTGNLTINRLGVGITYAFSAAPSISGNLNYTNNFGGFTAFGHITDITTVGGQINIMANYVAAATFEMLSVSNEAMGILGKTENRISKISAPLIGGNVIVTGSFGFNVQKCNLSLTLFSITDYKGGAYGYLFNNTIVGNVTLADNIAFAGGYNTTLRGNVITGLSTITISGSNIFEEADIAGSANHYIGNVIINGNAGITMNLSKADDSIFDGNLTINRSGAAGQTDAFGAQATINGNFTYVNNIGGNCYLGNATLPTTISGTINITATYPEISPLTFEMTSIQNQTNGGSIVVQNSRGFDVRNCNLKVVNLSITGYRANDYGTLYTNTIVGNVTTSDHISFAGGYGTYIRGNTITGQSSFTNNGSNIFYEADNGTGANHFIGDVQISGNSTGALQISNGDNTIFGGNLNISRTAAGTTSAFSAQPTITGNFTYTNNFGGDTSFGNNTLFTVITGTINMNASYVSPALFELLSIENQTAGGSITATDSRGFDVRNSKLKVNNLSITGFRANQYGTFYDNVIVGNVTLADNAGYSGGYATNIRNNTITGNSIFTNNGTNQFNDGNGASFGNKYIGNVTYNKNGAAMNIATSTGFNEYSGNLTLNSSTGINTGLFKFNGATNSTIEQLGTQAIVIEQLTVAKANPGKVILADPVTVSNSLILTSGNIVTTVTNLLTLNDNVTATGGSSASFVDGPLAKKGNDIFTFPIGKGTKYGPVSITAPASSTTSLFTAEYKDNNPTADGYNVATKEVTLNHVLPNEYWLVDGNSTVFVTMAWEAARSGESINPASARVAHWANNIWEDEGNSDFTGPANNGTVKTGTAISNFSPFAIASIDPFTPLPLTLISFTGKNTENGNQLTWQTADEKAFSHFEIERSADAKKFEKIGEVKGSSGEIYEFTDNQNSTLFYRLKMIDLDGKYSFSKIILIENNTENTVKIYPNPSQSYFSISNNLEAHSIQLINISGQIVKEFAPNSQNIYQIDNIPKGNYLVKYKSSKGLNINKLIKQ
jgi:Secretion system C-terminal sorting domain